VALVSFTISAMRRTKDLEHVSWSLRRSVWRVQRHDEWLVAEGEIHAPPSREDPDGAIREVLLAALAALRPPTGSSAHGVDDGSV